MREHYVLSIFYVTIFCALSFVYSKHSLHMFQQQHYELKRYSKWLFNKNNIHFSPVLVYIALALIIYFLDYFKVVDNNLLLLFISLFITVLFTIYVVYMEAKKYYAIDLVLTARVKRQIFVYTILLVAITYAVLILYENYFLTGIVSVYLPYLLVYLVAIITYPIEELIKKRYENEARQILDKMDNLIKIGITGSYGKTSTKNIINDIVSDNYFTLMTPASFNTPMGITRTIREQLKPIHEVFVCEMGADKINDISYLMNFIKPKFGVVTSIGPQHLSTFGTIGNIVYEKMKEIELLPSDGIGIINVDNELIANYQIKNNCKIIRVGIDNQNADYVAKNIKYTSEGSSFSVKIGNKSYKFNTLLLGKNNITNILIGIAAAVELNIDIKDIVKKVSGIKQISHRLEVKRMNNMTFIDDAFNSNPVGSKMAIDVLQNMNGKKIVITPGMIDLGKIQDKTNEEFGEYMADKVDYVLLVAEKQTKPIYNGLVKSGFDSNKIKVFENTKDAINYAYANFTSDDTILIENDLPDAFNV